MGKRISPWQREGLSRNALLAVSRLPGVKTMESLKELQREGFRGPPAGEVELVEALQTPEEIPFFQEDKISVGIRKGASLRRFFSIS